MPGRFRKVPPRPAAGKLARLKPAVAPRPPAPSRPSGGGVRRSANLQRLQEREVRRQGVSQTANQNQTRPRPSVRPAAPPQRNMPPKPLPTRHKPARPAPARPTRPAGSPPGPQVKPRRAVPGQASSWAVPSAVSLLALNTASAHPDISSDISFLNSALEDLQEKSAFGEIQEDVTNLDATLNNISRLLESARDKGYRYQKDLDQQVYQVSGQWQSIHDQVVNSANQQALAFQPRLPALNPHIQRLNSLIQNPTAAASVLRLAQSMTSSLSSDLDQIQRNIEALYNPLETQAQQLNSRLTQVHWALDQINQAKFTLETGENLVMAVPARWDQEGKDDPEGILYLTNRRLIFERKEKVATKKILFITTASELVHEVQISQPLDSITGVKADNKGLFGHQDFVLVDFSSGNLGSVPFHINGQDSKSWQDLIERARSGQIQADLITSGGLSMADLTQPISSADILVIQNEVNELQDEMMLKTAREELTGLENDISSLERRLSEVRARGYAIEKDLEADVKVLGVQWLRVKENVEKMIDQQSQLLSQQMKSIQQMAAELAGQSQALHAAKPLFMQTKSAIASAEAQADAAESTVLGMFDAYFDEVTALSAHIDWVAWMLDALDTASFTLLATECGIAATEAIWQAPGMEPENGILYLTDQRLLWEDRVGTFELKLEIPLQQILEVKVEAPGEGEDAAVSELLAFSLSAAAPLPLTNFHLALPVGDDWVKMVGRARSGGYAQDRAVEIDPEELERIRNAPQQCPNCGAMYSAPILRGQNELTCEYCGLATRF